MKHLKKFNEDFDPMGSWNPNHPSNKKEEPKETLKFKNKYEDITRQVNKTHFNKYAYLFQYKVGDIVKIKDGRKIKEVTITDIKEIPYRNGGDGNAFVPHSFTYTFEPVIKPKYLVKNDRNPYYDADITKKVDKTHFNKYAYLNQHKVGDIVKVKDGRKIKEVTITDIKEIPYRNVAGGNAFVPHSFTYTFENLKTFESVDDTWKPIYKEWLSRPFTISKIERKNTKLSQQDLLNMFKRELESKDDWNPSWTESYNDACKSC